MRAAPLAVLLAALLGACASPPIETDLPPSTPAPSEVAADPDGTSGAVLWGGELLGSSNLDGATQFEVLAYPLDRRQRPMTGRPSQGRFLIIVDGYLETLDYADGRLVTVLGALDGTRDGTIGEARLVYPVVRSEELHLWRDAADGGGRPNIGFGIGVSIGN